MRRVAPMLLVCLALTGCKDDEAAELKARLPPPSDLVEVLERALSGATSSGVRARVLIGVADGELSAGAGTAKARLSAATVATSEISLPSAQASLRARLVELWCRAGEVARAQGLVTELGSSELAAESQVALTRAMVAAGKLDEAQATARAVTAKRYRGAALLEVVRGLIDAGQRPQAGRLVGAFKDLPERDQALSEVAGAYARAGQMPQVHGAIDSIGSPHWRGAAQVELASSYWRRGKRGLARGTAKEIESEWMRVRALGELYLAARAKGRKKAAARLLARATKQARDISDPLMQSSALAEVVERLGQTGRAEEAEALLAEIPDKGTQRKAEAALVARHADAGRFEAADRVLKRVEADAVWGGQAARDLAVAYVEAGRLDEALATVGRIRAPDLRLPALGYVAAIQAAKQTPITAAQQAAVEAELKALAGIM